MLLLNYLMVLTTDLIMLCLPNWIKKLGKRINLSLGARYEQFMLKTSELYEIAGDSINSFKPQNLFLEQVSTIKLAEGTFLRSSWGQGYRFPQYCRTIYRN